MRLATATTLRVIACAEDLPRHVGLTRGVRAEAQGRLERHGAFLEVEERRTSGEPVGFRFQGTLTPVQASAAAALLDHDIGAFVALPGVGKTVVGTYMVAAQR
jgi:superfamily II DNA or RNA helicase